MAKTRNKSFLFQVLFFTGTKYVYMKSTKLYVPLSELGLSQPLSFASECAPPPRTGGGGGGGAHSPAGEVLGEVLIPTTGEKAKHSACSVFTGLAVFPNGSGSDGNVSWTWAAAVWNTRTLVPTEPCCTCQFPHFLSWEIQIKAAKRFWNDADCRLYQRKKNLTFSLSAIRDCSKVILAKSENVKWVNETFVLHSQVEAREGEECQFDISNFPEYNFFHEPCPPKVASCRGSRTVGALFNVWSI